MFKGTIAVSVNDVLTFSKLRLGFGTPKGAFALFSSFTVNASEVTVPTINPAAVIVVLAVE